MSGWPSALSLLARHAVLPLDIAETTFTACLNSSRICKNQITQQYVCLEGLDSFKKFGYLTSYLNPFWQCQNTPLPFPPPRKKNRKGVPVKMKALWGQMLGVLLVNCFGSEFSPLKIKSLVVTQLTRRMRWHMNTYTLFLTPWRNFIGLLVTHLEESTILFQWKTHLSLRTSRGCTWQEETSFSCF